jgi:hypothetical protein
VITVTITIEEWRDPDLDLLEIDRRIHAAEGAPFALRIRRDEPCDGAVGQILTRYQRLFPARNAASASELFSRILELHRSLHDLTKPLVRADWEHAIDVWQWTLRLDPGAPLEVQVAALFHDVERLRSEADRRIEHLAPDYQSFKDQHAETGAELVRTLLRSIDAPDELADRAARLIERHERRGRGDLQLLNDADSLSFFSLNSPGFLAYFGSEHTARKVRYTLGRMSDSALERLPGIRLPREVRALVDRELQRA